MAAEGRRRGWATLLGLGIVLWHAGAAAQPVPPAAHDAAAVDLMNLLAERGLHDIAEEPWNLYGQMTLMTAYKPRFAAPYTNRNGSINSLVPDAEQSFTGTLTLFFGLRLWPGGELYFAPEAVTEQTLSSLRGLSGVIENFELQKTGSLVPTFYRSRLYLRQSIDLGGSRAAQTSEPLQLAQKIPSRRLVLSLGYLSFLDVLDRNGVVGDLRQSYFNEAFMAHAAWDFPADARGYTWGAIAELLWEGWALRLGRMVPPINPNVQELTLRFWARYGDALELGHDHRLGDRPGVLRLLVFRNVQDLGSFDGALEALASDPTHNARACQGFNFASGNFLAPDVCWVRRPQVKWGVGVNFEQQVTGDVGAFGRYLYADGRAEVGAFNSVDSSLTLGLLAKGRRWHRAFDVTGLGVALNWISFAHARYLAAGGIDTFLGDGALQHAVEGALDLFYSVNLWRIGWLAADYQFIWNPGYNADRGPVHLISGRLHAEF